MNVGYPCLNMLEIKDKEKSALKVVEHLKQLGKPPSRHISTEVGVCNIIVKV